MAIPQRPCGCYGLMLSAQGLGSMGMSFGTKEQNWQDKEGVRSRVICSALEAGVTHLDTADVYGPSTIEVLIGKAIKDGREQVNLATKFGFVMPMDHVDLYYLHRVDRRTPIEETVKAMAELVKEGKVKYLGLCEASPAEVRAAHAVHPISAVQLDWSLWTRDAEEDLIPMCRELGIGIVAHSPLGWGFLTGDIKSPDDFEDDDFRKVYLRMQGDNFKKNLQLVEKMEQVAARKGCTPGQLALAWLHAQGEDVFPIPGTKREEHLAENIAAFELSQRLTKDDLAEIEAAVPRARVAGDRYPEFFMKTTYEHSGRKQAEIAGAHGLMP